MLYMIKLHHYQGDVLSMEQATVSKNFLDKFGPDIYKTSIKRWIFDDSDEIEIWLPRSSSKFWNISGGLF